MQNIEEITIKIHSKMCLNKNEKDKISSLYFVFPIEMI